MADVMLIGSSSSGNGGVATVTDRLVSSMAKSNNSSGVKTLSIIDTISELATDKTEASRLTLPSPLRLISSQHNNSVCNSQSLNSFHLILLVFFPLASSVSRSATACSQSVSAIRQPTKRIQWCQATLFIIVTGQQKSQC